MQAPGIHVRKRIVFLLFAILVAGVGLAGRLAYWQIYRSPELAVRAEDSRTRRVPLRAPRGEILDRNGWLLAGNKTADSVYVRPAEVCVGPGNRHLPPDACERRKQQMAAALAQVLDLPVDKVLARLSQRSSFVYLKRKVSDKESQTIRSLLQQGQLPGVGLEPETERYYPEGTLAAHILGFVGIDNQGLGGVEFYYHKFLQGTPGGIEVEYTALGHEIPPSRRKIVPAQPGMTLVLTIDTAIQQIVERGLEQVVNEYQAEKAAAIVMKVDSGDILAMGAYPSFDPNRYGEYPAEQWRNWLVADAYYPGSIFKPVTAAAALEEGLVRPDTPFHDPGCIRLPGWGRPFCNWDRKGFSGTFTDVFIRSSNVGFATVGMNLGRDRFYKYLDLFNLNRKTGIDVPGEGESIIPKKPTDLDLAIMGVGQTLTVTPVAMLAAINAIANDGVWVQPHLMKELRAPGGETITFQPVRRQIISQKTARELQAMMAEVVARGTGRAAQVPGYQVAGKTGTAEKCQGCQPKQYIASFAGFAPVPDPQVAVIISVHNPRGVIYGGQVAAPIFSQLVGDILRYLEIPPQVPVEPPAAPAAAPGQPQQVHVPDFTNLPVAAARAAALGAGLTLQVEGEGPVVVGQDTAPGTAVPRGSAVGVRLGVPQGDIQAGTGAGTQAEGDVAARDGLVAVPALGGLTLRQAAEVLARHELELRFTGTGAVVRQEPAPGTMVPRGTRVTVWLEPPTAAGP